MHCFQNQTKSKKNNQQSIRSFAQVQNLLLYSFWSFWLSSRSKMKSSSVGIYQFSNLTWKSVKHIPWMNIYSFSKTYSLTLSWCVVTRNLLKTTSDLCFWPPVWFHVKKKKGWIFKFEIFVIKLQIIFVPNNLRLMILL